MKIAALAAALLCATSAHASRIYTFTAETVTLAPQWAARCDSNTPPGQTDREYGCFWRDVAPSSITGRLQLADGTGLASRSDVEAFTFYGFPLQTLGTFSFDRDARTGTMAAGLLGSVRLSSADGLWFGAYTDDNRYCSMADNRCAFAGRWVEQGSSGGGGTVPLPGTLPLMALASFGIAGALRRRKMKS